MAHEPYLNSVLHKSLPQVRVNMCISLSLLSNGSVKKRYRGNENAFNNRTVEGVFYAVRIGYYYYSDQHEIHPATCTSQRSLSDVGCDTGDHSEHDLSVKDTEYKELLLRDGIVKINICILTE